MKKKLKTNNAKYFNAKDFKKAVKKAKKNEVIIFDEARPTKKEIDKWANQKINIKCTMSEAGDLMDLLFMADSSPFNNDFRDTIKLNKMEKAYAYWLNKMIYIVCPEIKNTRRKTKRRKK